MKPPPGLFISVLLLWGWQTGMPWLAVALGVLLEAPRWVRFRWEFSQLDLDRIWNLCAGLFFALIAYLLASEDNGLGLGGAPSFDAGVGQAMARSSRVGRFFFQWLLLAMMPIIFAQAWGTVDRIPYSTFSWFLRRRARGAKFHSIEPGLNISWPAVGLMVMSAGAGAKPEYFLQCVLGLAAWALWPLRNRGLGRPAWVASLAVAAVVAFGAQAGLRPLRAWLQQLESELLNRPGDGGFDSRESRTRLGQVGALKNSGRIVVRVEVPEGERPPELLREASYDTFKTFIWQNATNEPFAAVPFEAAGLSWILRPTNTSETAARIWAPIRGGRSLLPLPLGSARLTHLPALAVETNAFGALRVEGPALVGLDVQYQGAHPTECRPRFADRAVPEAEAADIAWIAREMGLRAGAPDDQNIRAVSQYFARHFSYSLIQTRPGLTSSNRTALGRFLTTSRSGHCEYFATAGALLLRHVGIPTRYAVGWSVQERKGRQYVVRARHAHAWTLAFVNGVWRELDFTPGHWAAAEREHRSSLEPWLDAWWRVVFEFNRLRYSPTNLRTWLLVPAVLGLLLAAGQIVFKRSWRARSTRRKESDPPRWPGLDSEFYAVAAKLRGLGFERRAGETWTAWCRRVDSFLPGPAGPLKLIIDLHHRMRFDPRGLEETEIAELTSRCRRWVEELNPNPEVGRDAARRRPPRPTGAERVSARP